MKKSNKTEYLKIIKEIADCADDNISAAVKTITSDFPDKRKSVSVSQLRQKIYEGIEKDYFTPLEREDIYMICNRLCELADNTALLLDKVKDCDIFKISSDATKITHLLKSITECLLAIASELEKYPRCVVLNDLFLKHDALLLEFKKLLQGIFAQYNDAINQTIINLAVLCARNCKEAADTIQYSIIKNS